VTQKSRRVYLQDPRSGNWCKTSNSMKTWMRLKEIYSCHLRGFARKSQNSELSGCCAGPVDFIQSYGMQYESENPLSGFIRFFPRKFRRSQWQKRWKISPRHYGYGKAAPRQVDLNYVGRILLDTEEGCTWRQIPAKVVHFYIWEECFCLFREYVKYYFAHLNSSTSLKPCPIENSVYISEFSIIITAKFIYCISWDKKKR
jgi:hypothetical protein